MTPHAPRPLGMIRWREPSANAPKQPPLIQAHLHRSNNPPQPILPLPLPRLDKHTSRVPEAPVVVSPAGLCATRALEPNIRRLVRVGITERAGAHFDGTNDWLGFWPLAAVA